MARQTEIILFHGNVAALPSLRKGEPAFAVDTGQLYVGNGVSAVPIGAARIPAGNYGDITVDSLGTTWTINARVVTAAKMAAIATARLLGRKTAGTGDVETITIADAIAFATNYIDSTRLFQVSTATLLGRKTAGTGNLESLTISEALDVLSATQGAVIYRGASAWSALAPPSGTKVLTSSGGDPSWGTASGGGVSLVLIEDQQTSGTGGGTATSGSFQQRPLNTIVADIGGFASLSANQFTLAAGTWDIEASAPSVNCSSLQARLFDVTNSTVVAYGEPIFLAPTGAAGSSRLNCQVVIASPTQYQIEARVFTTVATYGFGFPGSFGTEVYARVVARKIA